MIPRKTLRTLALAGILGLILISAACAQKTKGQQEADKPPVAVDATRAATADFQQSVEVVGVLSPKFSADVKSEYPGIVSQILVSEWVPVKKGQVLARLDAREGEAALLQARAEAARADREYERAVKLKEVGLMTAQGLEDTETIREAAGAQLALAKARLDKTVIRAPMDGIVSMRAVSPGDKAGDATLFRVVDNAVFDLKVTVPSGRISAVEVGQPLVFSTEAVPGRAFDGKVAFINPAADEASRAVGVIVEVLNADGSLRSGLFVKGRIVTGARQGVLQVPKSALLTWDLESKKAECFLVQDDKALRRAVTTGAVEGESVEITSGLGAGDTVVTRGGFNLSDGDRVVASDQVIR
jgi:RND family efflux transporter MFP subunit